MGLDKKCFSLGCITFAGKRDTPDTNQFQLEAAFALKVDESSTIKV
jgi:hypothetical protein